MKISAGFLIAALLCFTQSVFAVDSSVLTQEPSEAQEPPRVVPQTITTGMNRPHWDEFSLRLAVSPVAYGSYKLDGKGLTNSLEMTRGTALGGEIRFSPVSSWYSFSLGAKRQTIEFLSKVTLYQPPGFNVVHFQYYGGMTLYPWQYFSTVKGTSAIERLGLNIGGMVRKRSGIENTPTPIVTTLDEIGIYFGPTYIQPLSSKFYLDLTAEGFVPFFHNEAASDTGGGNLYTWAWEGKGMLTYRAFSFMELAMGFNFGVQYSAYDGQGRPTRQAVAPTTNTIQDGKETEIHWGIPVEARFFF